jgi:hypothetical protein
MARFREQPTQCRHESCRNERRAFAGYDPTMRERRVGAGGERGVSKLGQRLIRAAKEVGIAKGEAAPRLPCHPAHPGCRRRGPRGRVRRLDRRHTSSVDVTPSCTALGIARLPRRRGSVPPGGAVPVRRRVEWECGLDYCADCLPSTRKRISGLLCATSGTAPRGP